ncbi:hypothetical protein [Conchiformibius steedae]|uniref:hypothetical protein n=1 Tax=Conchiformibius steedae TaxID=153493 RepID=UPI0026EBAAC8|nr:hypothetical protein [Conchiformibius steedae]
MMQSTLFPFPMPPAAGLDYFNQDVAKMLDLDLRQKHQYDASHLFFGPNITHYVCNRANGMTEQELNTYHSHAVSVRASLMKNHKLLSIVESSLSDMNPTRCPPRDIYACYGYGGVQAAYFVVERTYNFSEKRNPTVAHCWRLFSDGVMLPVQFAWNGDIPQTQAWEKVGVMRGSRSSYTLDFVSDVARQGFPKTPTVDDYFAEQGVNTDLGKMAHFFTKGQYHSIHFETQETYFKFNNLFPEVVKTACEFAQSTPDGLMKLGAYFRKSIDDFDNIHHRPFARPQPITAENYAFGFTLWYLLFGGKNDYPHNMVWEKYGQAVFWRQQLSAECSQWGRIVNYLEAAKNALLQYQDLAALGYVINQSQFVHEGRKYLLTGFNTRANNNMELTLILKNGALSESSRAKQYTSLYQVKQGSSPFIPLTDNQAA